MAEARQHSTRRGDSAGLLGRWLDQHAGRVVASLLVTVIVGLVAFGISQRDGQRSVEAGLGTVTEQLKATNGQLAILVNHVDTLRMTQYTADEAKALEAKIYLVINDILERLVRIESSYVSSAHGEILRERIARLETLLDQLQRTMAERHGGAR